jgi:hypothetical protein
MILIYGASDDLIEIDGDVSEEFQYQEDYPNFIATSNGLVFHIAYDRQGVWRITPKRAPAGSCYIKEEAPADDEDNYSDRVTVSGVEWVVPGIGFGGEPEDQTLTRNWAWVAKFANSLVNGE